MNYEGKSEEVGEAIPEQFFPPCIKKILLGLRDGRKRAVFILLNFLRSVGWGYDAIEQRLQEWNKVNPEPVREVILKPYQYSCFNYNDRNRSKLFDPEKYDAKSFQKCLAIAEAVLTKKYADPTNGATHYHTLNIKPRWAKSSKMKKIGRIKDSAHIFYREL